MFRSGILWSSAYRQALADDADPLTIAGWFADLPQIGTIGTELADTPMSIEFNLNRAEMPHIGRSADGLPILPMCGGSAQLADTPSIGGWFADPAYVPMGGGSAQSLPIRG